MNPTRRQKQVLDFIASYIDRAGMSPTLQEIADGIGLKSLATVSMHLAGLKKRSMIEMTPAVSRSIRLISQKKRIVWEMGSSDCKAYFENDPAKWESGHTLAEAIGMLVIAHRNELNLSVVMAERKAAA